MAAEHSEEGGLEFTEDGDRNDGSDGTDVGTGEDELSKVQDEGSGEIPVVTNGKNSGEKLGGDPNESPGESSAGGVNGDPVEDLNLSDLELDGLDFEDDDDTGQAGGGKEKIILMAVALFLVLCSSRWGPSFFFGTRGNRGWTSWLRTLNQAA